MGTGKSKTELLDEGVALDYKPSEYVDVEPSNSSTFRTMVNQMTELPGGNYRCKRITAEKFNFKIIE